MTVASGFFNSINDDRLYDAGFFADYFASFIGNGVFPDPANGLQVVEGQGLKTVIRPGKGWIKGYYIVNDEDLIIQHDIAEGSLHRIDRIILQLSFPDRAIHIMTKKGTPASKPVAPSIIRDTQYYELVLADVFISAGSTVTSQSNITDQRFNKSLCGIVSGVVDQIDTTGLFVQYEKSFDEWFNAIQEILNESAVGNLTNRILNHENAALPHQFTDESGVKYNYGWKVENGVLKFVYEEVV